MNRHRTNRPGTARWGPNAASGLQAQGGLGTGSALLHRGPFVIVGCRYTWLRSTVRSVGSSAGSWRKPARTSCWSARPRLDTCPRPRTFGWSRQTVTASPPASSEPPPRSELPAPAAARGPAEHEEPGRPEPPFAELDAVAPRARQCDLRPQSTSTTSGSCCGVEPGHSDVPRAPRPPPRAGRRHRPRRTGERGPRRG